MDIRGLHESVSLHVRGTPLSKTYLDTELPKWLWREQSTDLCDDWPVQTTNDDPVSFSQNAVRQHDIDRRSKTLDDLDLQNRALQLGQIHQPVAHPLLSEVDQQHDHIGDALAGVRRRWHQRDVLGKALVLIIQNGIETLLGKGKDSVLDPMLELPLDRWFLFRKGILEGVVRCCFPSVYTIDLRFCGCAWTESQRRE